jgi:hypothetical protein
MRFLARVGRGLCGLSLVAVPAVMAQPPSSPDPASRPAPAQAPGHHHKGLFGYRHCVECQRAYAKAHDGVDVPPPPSTLPAGVVPAGAVPARAVHQHAAPGNVECAACQAGEVIVGPVTYIDQPAPGHAMVGGPVMMAGEPGHAVVGGGMPGMDPAPIGMARATQAQLGGPRMAAAGPRGSSPYDPAVRPTSIPPQTALDNSSTGRPHIISHLFGIGGISRAVRENREDSQKQQHASIVYDPPSQAVNELPASMVYGPTGR